MSPQFLVDLERGKPGEQFVAELLRSWGEDVEEVNGYFPAYDLRVKRNGRTIEVKYDIRASETQNVCLELDALFHSKADLLAIVTDNPRTVYFTPLQEALRLAKDWPRKKAVGERGEVASLVPILTFIERLHPQILTTK